METIRLLIHKNVENITEEFKWSRPVFKSTKAFAYIEANKNYVNLGFYKDFEKLNDPEEVLEGTGKTMRHIKLKSISDIDFKRLSEWLMVLTTE